MFQAIQNYLELQGNKYVSPAKAGDLAPLMEDYRRQGQEARQEFTALAQAFQALHPEWELHRSSQWMNQAQRLRPHFWAYLQREGKKSEPMLALRLYGDRKNFGVSLEVSFLERMKDEESLAKQAKVLEREISAPLYYLAQGKNCNQVLGPAPKLRQQLLAGLEKGDIRKVLVKGNVDLTQASQMTVILEQLEEIYQLLEPIYLATR